MHRVVPRTDGRVLIEMTMHARGGSGAPLSERTAHIWTLRGSKLPRNEPLRESEYPIGEPDR